MPPAPRISASAATCRSKACLTASGTQGSPIGRLPASASRAASTRGWNSPYPPADLFDKTPVEFDIIGMLRRLSDALVEPVGVVANQNAPALGLDAIENDPGCRRCRRRRLLKKSPGAFGGGVLDIVVRHRSLVDTYPPQALARLQDV